MDDLKKQADELGIKIDNSWDAARLQHEIDKALADDKPDAKKGGKAKTQPFRINRDYWDEKGERHRKGQIVDMTLEDALDGVESGALSRVKG